MPRRVACGGEVQLDREQRVRRAGQRALQAEGARAVGDGAREDREVLLVVRAGVRITRIVRRDADGSEVDSQPAVVGDHVPQDGVPCPIFDSDACQNVEPDRVGVQKDGGADERVAGPLGDEHAVRAVAEVGRSREIGPDEVPRDDVEERRGALNGDTRARVPRNDVRVEAVAAGNRVGRRAHDRDALTVGERARARPIDPDHIPRDVRAGRAASAQAEPAAGVARQHVAKRRRAADQVALTVVDQDAVGAIRTGERAGRIGADAVHLDAMTTGALQDDAGAARCGGGSAAAEAVDGERVDNRAVAGNDQPIGRRPGIRAVQLDERLPGPAGLRFAVDGHRLGDRRQLRRGSNRVHAAAGNREGNQVGARAGVRVEQRLSQRAAPGIVGVDDREAVRPANHRRGRRCRVVGCVGSVCAAETVALLFSDPIEPGVTTMVTVAVAPLASDPSEHVTVATPLQVP